jgi:hypothetical protein
MERAKGIEPSYEAWEASVLPLNYARADLGDTTINATAARGKTSGGPGFETGAGLKSSDSASRDAGGAAPQHHPPGSRPGGHRTKGLVCKSRQRRRPTPGTAPVSGNSSFPGCRRNCCTPRTTCMDLRERRAKLRKEIREPEQSFASDVAFYQSVAASDPSGPTVLKRSATEPVSYHEASLAHGKAPVQEPGLFPSRSTVVSLRA